MNNNLTSINGMILKPQEFVISMNERGFKYGDGFFETIKVFNKKPLFLEYHAIRIQNSLSILSIQSNLNFIDLIKDFIQKNEIIFGKLNLYVWRKGSELYTPDLSESNYAFKCILTSSDLYSYDNNGFSTGIVTGISKQKHPLYSIKLLSSAHLVLAALESKKEGWDEGILLNQDGNVCEFNWSSIIWIKDEIIYFIQKDEGQVLGVFSNFLYDFLSQNSDYVLRYSKLTINELLDADEIISTNVIKGIQSVKTLQSKTYSNDITRVIYSKVIAFLNQN